MKKLAGALLLLGWGMLASAEVGDIEDTIPHIPEPMVFDLMRPLHARAGEVEVNSIGLLPPGGRLHWAPELEATLLDGLAIEVEMPFENLNFESMKLGLQATLGNDASNVHGLQFLAQKPRSSAGFDLTGLYLWGHRIDDQWSLLSMTGMEVGRGWKGLQNLSLFFEPNNNVVLGLETQFKFSAEKFLEQMSFIPQIHLSLGTDASLQLGAGWTRYANGGWETSVGVRVIVDLTPNR